MQRLYKGRLLGYKCKGSEVHVLYRGVVTTAVAVFFTELQRITIQNFEIKSIKGITDLLRSRQIGL